MLGARRGRTCYEQAISIYRQLTSAHLACHSQHEDENEQPGLEKIMLSHAGWAQDPC